LHLQDSAKGRVGGNMHNQEGSAGV
jgi:hypothetical protein